MRAILFLILSHLTSFGCWAQTVEELRALLTERDVSRFEESLSAARVDGDSSKVIVIKSLLANYYIRNHQFYSAEKELLECINQINSSRSLKTTVANTFSIYDAYNYLARLYLESGNYRKAKSYITIARKKTEASLRRGAVSRIENLNLHVRFFLKKNMYDSAQLYLDQLERELKRVKKVTPALSDQFLLLYKQKAEVQINKNEKAKAKKYLKTVNAALLGGKPFSKNTDTEVVILESQYALLQQRPDEAINKIRQIKSIKDSVNTYPEILRVLIIAAFQQHRYDEVLALGEKLVNAQIANVRTVFSSLSSDEKQEFNNRIQNDLSLLNTIAFEQRKTVTNEEFLKKLFEFRIQTRGLLLEDIRSSRFSLSSATQLDIKATYASLKTYKQRLALVYSDNEKKELQQNLKDSIEMLERKIAAHIKPKPLSLAVPRSEMQGKLKAEEAAIEIMRVARYSLPVSEKETLPKKDSSIYIVFVLTSKDFHVVFMENADELDSRYIKDYHRYVGTRGITVEVNPDESMRDTVSYKNFWSPIEAKLGQCTRIYIAADGVYSKIGLNAIHDGQRYLYDRYKFVFLSSLRELTYSPSISHPGKNGILVGRPVFDSTLLRDIVSSKEVKFSDLPGTETEIIKTDSILRKYGWQVQTYLNKAATESVIKSSDNPAILHLATHGYFFESDEEADPMLQSGLVFTSHRGKSIDILDDGVLTAYEAADLSLDKTQIVVLSACQTGLGALRSGEGVYGLQRAFEIAGVENIIMSLWDVDDKATSYLMANFYKHFVESNDVHDAFRRSQDEVRKIYPQPRYWAGFVVTGR